MTSDRSYQAQPAQNLTMHLFNPAGQHVSTEHHNSEFLAWAAGENWRLLTPGNRYSFTRP